MPASPARPAPSAKTLDALRRLISECGDGIADARHIAKEARKLAPDPRATAVEADARRQETTWRNCAGVTEHFSAN